MRTLNLDQFKIERGQSWALCIRKNVIGELALQGQNQNVTRPFVYATGLGDKISRLMFEAPYPTYIIPIPASESPSIVKRTTEAEMLRRYIARLDVIVTLSYPDIDDDPEYTYTIQGDDEDVSMVEQLLHALMDETLLDRYAIRYHERAIVPAADVPYCLTHRFGDWWTVIFDGAMTSAVTITQNGTVDYRSGFGRVHKNQQFDCISPDDAPDAVQTTLRTWLNETRVVVVNGTATAVLRDGIVDLSGGGELHADDPKTAALEWFGLFDLDLIPGDLITQGEAAIIAQITPQAINNAIRSGRLSAYPVPGSTAHKPGDRRVSEADVRRLWEKQ